MPWSYPARFCLLRDSPPPSSWKQHLPVLATHSFRTLPSCGFAAKQKAPVPTGTFRPTPACFISVLFPAWLPAPAAALSADFHLKSSEQSATRPAIPVLLSFVLSVCCFFSRQHSGVFRIEVCHLGQGRTFSMLLLKLVKSILGDLP